MRHGRWALATAVKQMRDLGLSESDIARKGTRRMTLTQCRATRLLIGLTRDELGSAVSIPVAKIVAYEIGAVTLGETDRKALRRVLELGGVESCAQTRAISAGADAARDENRLPL